MCTVSKIQIGLFIFMCYILNRILSPEHITLTKVFQHYAHLVELAEGWEVVSCLGTHHIDTMGD